MLICDFGLNACRPAQARQEFGSCATWERQSLSQVGKRHEAHLHKHMKQHRAKQPTKKETCKTVIAFQLAAYSADELMNLEVQPKTYQQKCQLFALMSTILRP